MSKQNSLPNVDHVARLPQAGGIIRAIRSVDRAPGRPPPHGAHSTHAVAPVEQPDRSAVGWWLAALAFFIEGCAMYGASIYPGAEFPVPPAPASAPPRSVRVQQQPAIEQACAQPLESSVTSGLEWAVSADARPQRRWSWLSSIGGTVAAIWRYWRREWAVQTAVAALAEYDDRTLRDMGICGQSDIERVVRQSGDC
ncbi:DUF1127 domain-containing protein [Bradyrhizobium sp. CCBAU 51753]|uniref:DUF1127 domain-containing protein n=1 Tax=Bradyrhizobium sp. CCBAU 51753 TaxID=1325100 RepID=UPI00188C702C|nr:DUF1127 domain-containing protein [Bradyrhizobium sp. CCBAU 51753]QOZ27977.1 hypothetical protein XH93_33470 [Bradyrhizobium sp. CCBAU 51753]